ncbi:MAG: TlyA family RNA methyltransferase [Verrucomicrobiae bacterium]|nr:TlyA family RNA methyltransferase [Verrucomicrobiae bacterium]
MKRAGKVRLDELVVARGLAESRSKAQALIMAGEVTVGGEVATKAGQLCAPDAGLAVREAPRFVGRGGFKLEAALDAFGIDVAGARALDIGASTGGFTDCLLQRGAREVVALDVGRGQIHGRLRDDPRVRVIEGRNARLIEPGEFGDPFDIVVMDVSFISQRLIWPRVAEQLRAGGVAVALIKPQFEAGRAEVGRGGVVRDPGVRERVVAEIRDFAEREIGFSVEGVIESPVEGREGNREFLICAKKSAA